MSTTLDALARVECTTAHQLLSAVRYTTSPLGPTFIPALDDYLVNARANTFIVETPEEQLATEAIADPHVTPSSLNHGDLIEVQGPSGSGKTQLVLFLVMTSILPARVKFRDIDLSNTTNSAVHGANDQIRELALGGKAQSVIFVHPSTHASPVLRLSKLITSHVRHCLSSSELQLSANLQTKLARLIVKTALSRLTIFKLPIANASFAASDVVSPYAPLAATLAFLPQYVRQMDRELSLLVIDGIGDGFWQARWQREQRLKERQLPTSNNPQPVQQAGIRSSQDVTMNDIVKRIDRIRRVLGCAVIVTNQAIWRPTDPQNTHPVAPTHFWAQHLPAPFPSPFDTAKSQHTAYGTQVGPEHHVHPYWPLTAQITLLPLHTHMRQIRPDILLYDVLRKGGEGDKREQARLNAKLRGLVRLPGQLNAEQAGKFAFAVTEEEIETT
ncbi:hypothetical protein QFC22_001307 [Naganishia vaughanmartiniae]|uniref:Uncharacterized protein n=1 Tax=Naganishia vaughanmartiniae TaxID=1424756 RepID=A0ACC2XJ93_9TREE|nr:hypothetical protein QFC22_001307 [Naganishia vaughanmartiniae]